MINKKVIGIHNCGGEIVFHTNGTIGFRSCSKCFMNSTFGWCDRVGIVHEPEPVFTIEEERKLTQNRQSKHFPLTKDRL